MISRNLAYRAENKESVLHNVLLALKQKKARLHDKMTQILIILVGVTS